MTSSVLNSIQPKHFKIALQAKAIFAAAVVALGGFGLILSEPASAKSAHFTSEIKGETMVAAYIPWNRYERRGNYIIPNQRCARCL